MRSRWAQVVRAVAKIVLLVVVVPVGRASDPPPADELLKLEGAAFVEAAENASYSFYGERCDYTAAQLIAIADRLVPGVKSMSERAGRSDDLNPFSMYFGQACRIAGDEQLPTLIEMYGRLDPGSFEKSHVLFTLASRLIAREAAAIRAEGAHLRFQEATSRVPKEMDAAPHELQEAWHSYRRAQAAFEKAFPALSEVVDVSANERSFYKLIDAALTGATGRYDEVRQFGWTGANCLGVTDTADAQNLAVLLMLLRERRLDEAVGAALSVAGTEGSTSSPEAIAGSIVQLLEACGVNWQSIFAGAQAEREIRDHYYSGSGRPLVEAIGTYGSETGALLVHQLARLAKPKARAAYVSAFNSWIESSDNFRKCEGQEVSVGRYDHEKRIAPPLPLAIQRASLRLAEEFVDAECDEALAQYALHIFGRTQSPSSIPALQALTRHSSGAIVDDAQAVLCAMGYGTRAQKVSAFVLFRILLNGQPMSSGESVEWNISAPGGGGVISTTQTKSGGIVELPRLHFGNPQRSSTEVSLITLTEESSSAKFAVTVQAPSDLDAVTDVSVKLSPLEIVLQNVTSLNAPPPETATVLLLRQRESGGFSGGLNGPPGSEIELARDNLFEKGFVVATQPTVLLPLVQEGAYDVLIGVAGAEIWQGIMTVGAGTTRVEASLKPGSDVRFAIATPDGQRRAWAPLFQDGKEVNARMDWQTGSYRALPCGSYVLRIPGTDQPDDDRGGRKLKRGPEEVTYSGRDIAFTVEEGSPAVIDLAEIRLESLER